MRLQVFLPDVHTQYHAGFHHGLAALAASTRLAGHEMTVTRIDDDTTLETVVRAAKEISADVIGFSVMSNQMKFLRSYGPAVARATSRPIVVGGIHATLRPEECLRVDGVTCVCRGDGDEFVVSFLEAQRRGADWRDIPGVAFLDGGTLRTVKPAVGVSLDELPFPDYSVFGVETVLREFGRRFAVCVSRGCPFSCSYCSNAALRTACPESYGSVRFRTPENAVALVSELVSTYSVESLNFVDDLLLLRPPWTQRFLELYRAQVGLPFECQCRADLVSPDLVKLLAESNCVSVSIGVECGDERYRFEVLKKKVSDDAYRTAFRLLHAAGIRTYAFNMLGLPFERPTQAEATLRLNKELAPSAGTVFFFYPYPGTELARLAFEAGAVEPDYEEVCSYNERPVITEAWMKRVEIWSAWRRLRAFLWCRRLETSFPGPVWLRRLLSRAASFAFRSMPRLVEVVAHATTLKMVLRASSLRASTARLRP